MGGSRALSTYVAAAVALLFLVVHPLCGAVGYVPTLVISAICVYIGIDFLFYNLIAPLQDALNTPSSAAYAGNRLPALGPVLGSWAVMAVCVQKDMLLGTLLGIVGFQIAGRLGKKKPNQQADA